MTHREGGEREGGRERGARGDLHAETTRSTTSTMPFSPSTSFSLPPHPLPIILHSLTFQLPLSLSPLPPCLSPLLSGLLPLLIWIIQHKPVFSRAPLSVRGRRMRRREIGKERERGERGGSAGQCVYECVGEVGGPSCLLSPSCGVNQH